MSERLPPVCRRCESWTLADYARTRTDMPATLAEHEAVLAVVPACTCGRNAENRTPFEAAMSHALITAQLDALLPVTIADCRGILPLKAQIARPRPPDTGWYAELDETGWHPVLQHDNGTVSGLAVWFGTEAECLKFIHDHVINQGMLDE
jgi:hypothetical protein